MKLVIATVMALGLMACTEAAEAPAAPPAEAGPAPVEAVEPTDPPAAVELKLEGAPSVAQ